MHVSAAVLLEWATLRMENYQNRLAEATLLRQQYKQAMWSTSLPSYGFSGWGTGEVTTTSTPALGAPYSSSTTYKLYQQQAQQMQRLVDIELETAKQQSRIANIWKKLTNTP